MMPNDPEAAVAHFPVAVEFFGGPLDGAWRYSTSEEIVIPCDLGCAGYTERSAVYPHHRYVRQKRRDGDRYIYTGLVDR
jgi:hypothetical protein